MRFCSKCFNCKKLTEFKNKTGSTLGLSTICRTCTNKRDLEAIRKRPDARKATIQKYYHKDIEASRANSRAERLRNREKRLKASKIYRDENRQKVRDMANAWYHANKQKVFKKLKDKRHNDPFFKVKGVLKTRIQQAFKYKSWKKDGQSRILLGADYDVVKKHIERQFKKGMSWDNHGRYTWHMDHIIPLASAKTIDELKTLCHYTNLQPMWALENIQKADKVLPTQMKMTI